jgi:toxoflavin synthase
VREAGGEKRAKASYTCESTHGHWQGITMTMVTNYDRIGEDYKLSKQQPWRTFIESFSLMGLVGDVTGRTVIDVACGEGFYTRRLKQAGAERVLGVDVSEGMIELARAEEAARPLGIEYLGQDGKNLRLGPKFDLAVAAYLLNYARDRNELAAMCRSIAGCLKPGGRFVTVNSNPEMDVPRLPSFRKYGFEIEADGEVEVGSPYTWAFHLDTGTLPVVNYHLDRPAHEGALRSAGFREIRWHRPQAESPGEHWDLFLEHPPIALIECVK